MTEFVGLPELPSGSRDEQTVGATAALSKERAIRLAQVRVTLQYLEREGVSFTPGPQDGQGVRWLYEMASQPSSPWRTIYSAPLGRDFLAKNAKGDIRRCWRHKPSSRTDDILTFTRNGKFHAIAWMELPR